MPFSDPTQIRLVPALRRDLTLEPAGDACVLVDAALGRRIKLDPRGATVARALDAPQTFEALLGRIGGEMAALARAVASFERLHLLDTATARTLAADALATQGVVATPAAAVPLLIRADARFSCTMCGSCCGGHNVGPVSPAEMAALEPHRARLEAETGSAKGLFLEMPGSPPGGGALCQASGGSCVFLMENRQCRIHAELGAELKPRPCRIFPYEFIATPRGLAVTIQRECRAFIDARHGRPLLQDVDGPGGIREIAALAGRLPAVRSVIRFGTGRVLTWDEYAALEERLHAIVDEPAQADDASGTLVALAGALLETRDGGPAHTTARTPEGHADVDPLGALVAELGGIVETITDAMRQMRETVPAPTDELLVRADGLDHIVDALVTLQPDFRRVVGRLERAEQRSLFRDHWHHALMSKELLLADTVEAGLGRLVFQWLLAKALAIHRAREAKRRHLVDQEIMDGLCLVTFLFRHEAFLKGLLPHVDAAVTRVFCEHLPLLIERAAEVPDRDTRVELVKF